MAEYRLGDRHVEQVSAAREVKALGAKQAIRAQLFCQARWNKFPLIAGIKKGLMAILPGIMMRLQKADEVQPAAEASAADIKEAMRGFQSPGAAEVKLPEPHLVPHATDDSAMLAPRYAFVQPERLFIDIGHGPSWHAGSHRPRSQHVQGKKERGSCEPLSQFSHSAKGLLKVLLDVAADDVLNDAIADNELTSSEGIGLSFDRELDVAATIIAESGLKLRRVGNELAICCN